jgi:hypothetical protein
MAHICEAVYSGALKGGDEGFRRKIEGEGLFFCFHQHLAKEEG